MQGRFQSLPRSQFQLDLKKSEPERTMSGVGGVEVTSPLLGQWCSMVVDASIHTFDIPEIWHLPECLRIPRVQPSHFHNWDRRRNGDG